MTAEELQKKIETWAEICGITEELTSEKDKAAKELLQMMEEYSDETIDISIVIMTITVACSTYLERADVRGAIEKVSLAIFTLDEMYKNELAKVKDKYRWRKHVEEPVPNTGDKIEWASKYRRFDGEEDWVSGLTLCKYVKEYYDGIEDKEGLFWRPLEYPTEDVLVCTAEKPE